MARPCFFHSAALRRRLIRLFEKLRKKPCGVTAATLKRLLRLACCTRTIQRFLKSAGYKYRKRARKCALLVSDHQARLAWATAYLNFDFGSLKALADAKFFRMPLRVHGGPRSSRVWAKAGEAHFAWACAGPAKAISPGTHVFAAIVREAFL